MGFSPFIKQQQQQQQRQQKKTNLKNAWLFVMFVFCILYFGASQNIAQPSPVQKQLNFHGFAYGCAIVCLHVWVC